MRSSSTSGMRHDDGFPVLAETEHFDFPPKEDDGTTLVAWGGNLSPGMLLSAYEQGVFPWFAPGEPVLWHSPDPRFVIFPQDLVVSTSMRKVLRKGRFEIGFDRDVMAVIDACASIERPGQDGTWIGPAIREGYGALARAGWVHSAEARVDGELVGGCYGLRLGRVFYGESMFARQPNASKAAFLTLAQALFEDGCILIDCQVHTDHLESLGGKHIPLQSFLSLLAAGDARRNSPRSRRGSWKDGITAGSDILCRVPS